MSYSVKKSDDEWRAELVADRLGLPRGLLPRSRLDCEHVQLPLVEAGFVGRVRYALCGHVHLPSRPRRDARPVLHILGTATRVHAEQLRRVPPAEHGASVVRCSRRTKP